MRLEREGDMVPVRLLLPRSMEVTLLVIPFGLAVVLLQVIPAQLLLQGKD